MKKDLTIRKAFGVRLRKLRLERGLKQTGLGFEAEIEPGYISELELGKASPSLEIIISLASALECKPGDLINDL